MIETRQLTANDTNSKSPSPKQWAEAVLGTRVPSPGLVIGTWSPLTRGGRRALHQHLKAHPPTPLESVHDA